MVVSDDAVPHSEPLAGRPVAGAVGDPRRGRRSPPGVNSGWYRTPDVRMITATVVTGVLAGLAGIALTQLLHAVQHAAFGYTEEAFLTGVEQASAARRVTAMAIGGRHRRHRVVGAL